jgi:hypothetical protein
MIDVFLSPFDFIVKMPIEKQCHYFVAAAAVGAVTGAMLREKFKDSLIRYAGRALGAAAFCAICVFANHATQTATKLERELFAKEGKKISAEHAVTLTSKKGHTISIGEQSGLRGTGSELRKHDGRIRPSRGISGTSRSRFAAGSVGGNGSDGCRYDGVVDARRMLEQSGWWNASDAGRIQQSGKTQGEDF